MGRVWDQRGQGGRELWGDEAREKGATLTYQDLLGGGADWGSRALGEREEERLRQGLRPTGPTLGPSTLVVVPVERDGGGAPDCCHSVASVARRLM